MGASRGVVQDMVDPHVESLRRGRSFCEGVTDIGTVDALVLEGTKSEEEAQAGLFHAGGVRTCPPRVESSQTPRAFFVWASSVLTLYVHTQLKTEASGRAGIGSANIPCWANGLSCLYSLASHSGQSAIPARVRCVSLRPLVKVASESHRGGSGYG